MSARTKARRDAQKQARFDAKLFNASVRLDDKSGDEHRKAAAHAHVATFHAMEMDTPEAHKLAMQAHKKVYDMHKECMEGYDEEKEDD